MANSMNPDQTAPIGAVCSGSMLFASLLNLSIMFGNYLQQMTSADDIFKMHFFGVLRVKMISVTEDCFKSQQTVFIPMICHIMLHFIWVFTVCQGTHLEVFSIHRVKSGLQIRVRIGKLFSLFLIQNICCGYSKEPSQ